MNGQDTTGFWGDSVTQFFYALTPDRIIEAVEKALGRRCTGQLSALNSMENRVYELRFETDQDDTTDDQRDPSMLARATIKHGRRRPSSEGIIAKFYRPGRWSRAQILEEHAFLRELNDHEIPAVAPLPLADGSGTLGQLAQGPIFFALFPKIMGRAPDEITADDAALVGRLLARIHQVGRSKPAPSRPVLTPTTMGLKSLETLLSLSLIPDRWRQEYQDLVTAMIHRFEPWFRDVEPIRIHGDCHLGNLIYGHWQPFHQVSAGPVGSQAPARSFFFVDFDDTMMGPAVQDLWLLAPGRDETSQELLRTLVHHYTSMTQFDPQALRLIEPLRTLRMIHFSSWIARRWQDPSFPRVFETFGTDTYWAEQVRNLREQHQIVMGDDLKKW